MSDSGDRTVSNQIRSTSGTGSWSSPNAKASWSFSGILSMSASATTSTSTSKSTSTASFSSRSGSSSQKQGRRTPLMSYNAPDTPQTPRPSKKPTGPTVDSPFDFGTDEDSSFTIEECSDEEPDDPDLIGIPQLKPISTSPFLKGYPPSLGSHGISKATWASFLDTLSAFLEATVSQQAIDHAMDIATHVGKRPKKLAGNLASRTASIGQQIGNNAKRGNVLGVATGLLKGTISVPLDAVMSTTTAVLGLPITTAIAATRKPPTPRQRATAYLAVANEQWLTPRGLYGGILDTKGLGDLLGTSATNLPVVEEVDENGVTTEETQFNVLTDRLEDLEVSGNSPTQLGAETLWLVLTRVS